MRATLIDNPEEISEHEESWEALRRECGAGIYSSNFLTRSWFKAYGDKASPRIILIEDDGDVVGIAPLAVHVYRFGGLPIKVLALVGRVQGCLFVSPSTVMYRPGREDVLDRIMEEIRHLDWSLLNSIYTENIGCGAHFIDQVGRRWRSEPHVDGNTRTLELPEVGDIADLFDKGAKKNLNKRIRGMERDGHHAMLKSLRSEDLDGAVELYAEQHIERWASKGGSYFTNPENIKFLKVAFKAARDRGKGFAYELLIDGDVAAQNFGFVDGDHAYSFRMGMNNEFMKYSPGWMIKYLDLGDLRDHGIHVCQIGIGDEGYKQEMGGRETPLIGARVSRGAAAVMSIVGSSRMVRTVAPRLSPQWKASG